MFTRKGNILRNRWVPYYWVLRTAARDRQNKKTVNTGSCLSSFQNDTQYKGGEKLVEGISDKHKTSLSRTIKKTKRRKTYRE